jgi:C_GCAxxG_C_C family probable redox protein
VNKKDKAIERFNTTHNCAQSVLTAFTSELLVDEKVLNQIASGFGSGMGRLQKTCGAITGGIMCIGLKKTAILDKDEIYKLVQAFKSRFIAINKSTSCRDLLKCDLNTEKGQIFFFENDLKEKVCNNCVKTSIVILEDLLK